MTNLPEFSPEAIAAGQRLFASPAKFLRGVADLKQLPDPFPVEIAFAGRSNVGKSSLLNALTGRRQLARTSKEPGRTREINFFLVGESLAIVDLPGYGYAKAEKRLVHAWQSLIGAYLAGRASLRRVFLLVDARRGLTALDERALGLLDHAAVSYQVVLTKADKLKPADLEAIVAETGARIARRPAAYPGMHVTSSLSGAGIAELRAEIAQLLPSSHSL
jgi:GTP-binding protein